MTRSKLYNFIGLRLRPPPCRLYRFYYIDMTLTTYTRRIHSNTNMNMAFACACNCHQLKLRVSSVSFVVNNVFSFECISMCVTPDILVATGCFKSHASTGQRDTAPNPHAHKRMLLIHTHTHEDTFCVCNDVTYSVHWPTHVRHTYRHQSADRKKASACLIYTLTSRHPPPPPPTSLTHADNAATMRSAA